MQCVILAAGEGVRMRPLTLNVPKPLLKVNGKMLLVHLFESLPSQVDEIILVVGYLGQQIVDYFGNEFHRKKIKYVWQEKKEGTFRALVLCRSLLRNELFLVLNADDLFDAKSMQTLASSLSPAILVAEHSHPERFGVVEVDTNGMVARIEEKPERPKSKWVNCGPLLLTPRIFDYPPEAHPNGEYYLPVSVNQMLPDVPFRAIRAKRWITVGYPEDIEKAEKILQKDNA